METFATIYLWIYLGLAFAGLFYYMRLTVSESARKQRISSVSETQPSSYLAAVFMSATFIISLVTLLTK